MASKVKANEGGDDSVSTAPVTRKGRKTTSRLSSKHQVTIPVDVLREVGFKVGDELVFNIQGKKVIVTKKRVDLLEWIASLNGLYDGYDFAAERADAWPD